MRVYNYMKGDLPPLMYQEVETYFDNLSEDKYAEPGFRFRRFSEFYFDDRGYLRKHDDTEDFVQSSDINSAFGDVERKFEPVEDSIMQWAGFQMMFERFRVHTGVSSRIGCHQVRIIVGPDGVPAAPEGPHHDGFDYIGAFIVRRNNITGGEFCVWDKPDTEMPTDVYKWPEPLFKEALWTNETRHYGILNDRDFVHTGYDLNRVDPNKDAHWDWFVLTGNNNKQ